MKRKAGIDDQNGERDKNIFVSESELILCFKFVLLMFVNYIYMY